MPMRTRSRLCAAMATCVCVVMLGDPAAGQRDPKEGWLPLFNGRDLSGWKLREPDKPNGWIVADGVYINTPPSTDILTEQSFADFDLYVEVKPEDRTNSGLYLR